MTLRNRIKFYQQLAALSRGGVPIRTALHSLAERLSLPEVRTLAQQIEQGNTLEEAFTAARFSPFERHLVSAGERSAQLDNVFSLLGEFWMRELRFVQALVRQLYYPAAVAHLAVIAFSLFLLSTGPAAVIGSIVGNLITLYLISFIVYVVIRVSWSSPVLREFWLALPIIGGALKAANAYRWITALRMEFSAGVSFPDAVADAWRSSGYSGAEKHAEEGERGMRFGVELSELVRGWRQLPRDWVDFCVTAETSGEFEKMFTYLEREAGHTWDVKQEAMTQWTPKILTVAFLIIMAILIIPKATQAISAPIVNAENAINDVGH
jgi:general secretion pathway protein F